MSDNVIWNDLKNRGRKAEIFVEGKTLHEIAVESGLEEYMIRNRYRRQGKRTIKELTAPKAYSRSVHKRVYKIPSAGQRLQEAIFKKDISIHNLSLATGMEESTIYHFLSDGRDISSMRLCKLCAYLGVSMDYIMGLKQEDK